MFLIKIHNIVSDPETDENIYWSDEGTSFTVKQMNALCENVLPIYFKHNNQSSFLRQLNYYNFKKVRNSQN